VPFYQGGGKPRPRREAGRADRRAVPEGVAPVWSSPRSSRPRSQTTSPTSTHTSFRRSGSASCTTSRSPSLAPSIWHQLECGRIKPDGNGSCTSSGRPTLAASRPRRRSSVRRAECPTSQRRGRLSISTRARPDRVPDPAGPQVGEEHPPVIGSPANPLSVQAFPGAGPVGGVGVPGT